MQNNQSPEPVNSGQSLRDQLIQYSKDRMQRDRRYKNETIVILKERAAKRAQKQEQPK